MNRTRPRSVLGWLAVALATLLPILWPVYLIGALYALRHQWKRRAQNPPLPFREEQHRTRAHARIMADGPVPLPLVGEDVDWTQGQEAA